MATAYVYTPVGWVSGSAPTINGPDLSHMDAGIQQGAHITGLEADRTTALATANPGALMFCTDSQILYLSLGASGWQFLHARPVVVTALPASPVDGQEIEYVADATNGVRWRFRYNAGSASAYKWEYVGGDSIFSYNGTANTGFVTANVFAAITNSPSITLPFGGDWLLEWTAGIQNQTAAVTDMLIQPFAGSTQLLPAGGNYPVVTGPQYHAQPVNGRFVARGRAANDAITLYGRTTSGTSNWSIYEKRLYVRPSRIG